MNEMKEMNDSKPLPGPVKKLLQGWSQPGKTRSQHFFGPPDFMSLCRRYTGFLITYTREPSSAPICKKCLKELERLKARRSKSQ